MLYLFGSFSPEMSGVVKNVTPHTEELGGIDDIQTPLIAASDSEVMNL